MHPWKLETGNNNNVTDPIQYGMGRFIGLDCLNNPGDRKLGYWIAHRIQYPGYRIAANSIGARGIGIAM
jgi:hypothetical protein